MIKKKIRLNVNGRQDKRATDKFRLIKNTWKETAKIKPLKTKKMKLKPKRQKENINELINAISENKYEQSEAAAKSSTG